MQPINLQVVEKPILRDDGALDIVDIFPTIQGEGPFAGTPAIFVRLAGCDLQCPACDTNYTRNRKIMSVQQIANEIDFLAGETTKLVVITGGEPFRQGCGDFVCELIFCDYHIQFESNGTLYDETMEDYYDDVTIVCSPKTGSLSSQLLPHIDYLKYIVSADKVDPTDGLPLDSLNFGTRPARPWDGFRGDVYVQPCDDQNEVKNSLNAQAAIKSCMEFGYTLCLQLHKIVGLP